MTQPHKPTAWRFLLAAAIAFATVMALLPHPPQVPATDKVQHMAAFGVLTLLAALGYPDTPLHRLGERLSFLGAMIEVGQSIPALNRDCNILDWVVDTAAIIFVLLIVRAVRGRRATTL